VYFWDLLITCIKLTKYIFMPPAPRFVVKREDIYNQSKIHSKIGLSKYTIGGLQRGSPSPSHVNTHTIHNTCTRSKVEHSLNPCTHHILHPKYCVLHPPTGCTQMVTHRPTKVEPNTLLCVHDSPILRPGAPHDPTTLHLPHIK